MRSYGNYQQDNWVSCGAIAEFAYNNSVYSSTGNTPIFLTYCIHPLMSDNLQLSSEMNIPLASERAQSLVKIQS